MKKWIVVAGIIVVALSLISAGITKHSLFTRKEIIKKSCAGFTVIEAGKGIDCNGDTIRLEKTNGYFSSTLGK